jgi:hypothetical protein
MPRAAHTPMRARMPTDILPPRDPFANEELIYSKYFILRYPFLK